MSAKEDLKTWRKMKAGVERERRELEVKDRIVDILRPFTNDKRRLIICAAAAYSGVKLDD